MSKRDQILQTTLELVSELGFHATSVGLIIKKSGVASGTIYHHFKNKEDLIDTLYSELKKELGNAIISNIDQEMAFKEKFFLIWKNIFRFYIENPMKFEFLEDYANSPFVRKEIKVISQSYYKPLINYFESGIQMGILRSLPLHFLINIVFGNVATLARMIIMEEIEIADELLINAIQSSWDSVKIN
ncbi:MAG: TetR/AcrR family transcriptional regulator [Bacteroidales bacterium]|jgi:TetR/AcrR family transcriptional repressor of multidrug resistance operon|nr:TetR/AcrR family transcriptional regulator [Bacteroidales bacterium]